MKVVRHGPVKQPVFFGYFFTILLYALGDVRCLTLVEFRDMKLLVLAVLVFQISSVSAQDSLAQSDVYRFADATLHTYTQPVRWRQKQWTTFAGVLAGTAALTLFDKRVRHFFLLTERHFPQIVEDVGFHYGKPYSAFIFTGGFYLAGLILNDRWAKDTGLNLGATLLTSGLLQTLLKNVIGRARPGTEVGPYRFKVPARGDIAYHSFPSGHSSVAFGITMVLARRINNQPLKILFYTLAAGTALSRLHTDAHWFSDIAFGAVLAWVCDETVSKRLSVNGRRNVRLGNVKWTVAPTPVGLGIVGKF